MKFQFENLQQMFIMEGHGPLCMDRCIGISGDDGLVDYQTLS